MDYAALSVRGILTGSAFLVFTNRASSRRLEAIHTSRVKCTGSSGDGMQGMVEGTD